MFWANCTKYLRKHNANSTQTLLGQKREDVLIRFRRLASLNTKIRKRHYRKRTPLSNVLQEDIENSQEIPSQRRIRAPKKNHGQLGFIPGMQSWFSISKKIDGIHHVDKGEYTATYHVFMAKTSTIGKVKRNDRLAESMRNVYHRLWGKTSN